MRINKMKIKLEKKCFLRLRIGTGKGNVFHVLPKVFGRDW